MFYWLHPDPSAQRWYTPRTQIWQTGTKPVTAGVADEVLTVDERLVRAVARALIDDPAVIGGQFYGPNPERCGDIGRGRGVGECPHRRRHHRRLGRGCTRGVRSATSPEGVVTPGPMSPHHERRYRDSQRPSNSNDGVVEALPTPGASSERSDAGIGPESPSRTSSWPSLVAVTMRWPTADGRCPTLRRN